MLKHEIYASWFSKADNHPTSPCRLAAVIQEDGAAAFMIEGATGQVAHITVRSRNEPSDPATLRHGFSPSTAPQALARSETNTRSLYGAVVLHSVVGATTAALVFLAAWRVWPVLF